jgi:TolB-like protein/tRNA A-37 threonylcarbamoyl transferase component Bud32
MSDATLLDPPASVTGGDVTRREGGGTDAPASFRGRLGGRYELLALIGWGGMGNVYRARDLELDEIVALKMLRGASDADAVARLRAEVRLARRVTHPNVVRTFDIGEHDAGRFISMEYVDGESLAATLARSPTLPMATVEALAEAMIAGLAAAHAAGVIHRDLKPGNVLVRHDGLAKITDFGIATTQLSGTIDASGTPLYMSPEQLRGTDVDARADVYALGVVLFEAITGRRAFHATDPEEALAERLRAGALDPAVLRPDTPRYLVEVVRACTAIPPSERPLDATAVADVCRAAGVPSASRLALSGDIAQRRRPLLTRVAVLNLVGDQASAGLASAVTDEIIAALSRTPWLHVCSRGLVAERGAGETDPIAVGRVVDAQVVVTGEIADVGSAVVSTIRVFSVDDGLELWTSHFERSIESMLAFAVDVAAAIRALLDDDSPRTAPGSAIPIAAAELFFRARVSLTHRFASAQPQAVDWLAEAAALAPDNPRILSSYAVALTHRFSILYAGDADFETATRVIDRALAIAPDTVDAFLARAFLERSVGEHARTAVALRKAHELAPWDPEVHLAIGELLAGSGALGRGIEHYQTALELDPTLWWCRIDLAVAYALRGDLSRADAVIGPPPEDPGRLNAYWGARLRVLVWSADEARTARARESVGARPFAMRPWVDAFLSSTMGALDESSVAQLHAMGTKRGRALAPVCFFRCIYADVAGRLGRPDASMVAVADADQAGLADVAWLDLSPCLGDIRQRSEFNDVRARVSARAVAAVAAFDGVPS